MDTTVAQQTTTVGFERVYGDFGKGLIAPVNSNGNEFTYFVALASNEHAYNIIYDFANSRIQALGDASIRSNIGVVPSKMMVYIRGTLNDDVRHSYEVHRAVSGIGREIASTYTHLLRGYRQSYK